MILYRRLLHVLLGAGVALAVMMGTWSAPPEVTDVEPVNCVDRMWRDEPGIRAEISLVCLGGRSSGTSIGTAGTATATSTVSVWDRIYGLRVKATTVKVKAAPMPKIAKVAKKEKVPWPSKDAKRASDMDQYRVYQLYVSVPGKGSRLYKYGITKRGAARPKRQLKKCKKEMGLGIDCDYAWVRKDIDGWYNARKVEAAHTTKYKLRFKDCPTGMPTCM
ncbi:hypothetical protein [Nocardioides ferulae]|uniref:hypothetical protein n=1 Tax=Nocardioides ferulae TaxID=2340821 RepID=UPI000EACE495|nr:hypothetical protein [Nocardioides ferulae]